MKKNQGIKKLLRSRDVANVQLAIELLKGRDYPLSVWETYLKMARDTKVKPDYTRTVAYYSLNNKKHFALCENGCIRSICVTERTYWPASIPKEDITVKL